MPEKKPAKARTPVGVAVTDGSESVSDCQVLAGASRLSLPAMPHSRLPGKNTGHLCAAAVQWTRQDGMVSLSIVGAMSLSGRILAVRRWLVRAVGTTSIHGRCCRFRRLSLIHRTSTRRCGQHGEVAFA